MNKLDLAIPKGRLNFKFQNSVGVFQVEVSKNQKKVFLPVKFQVEWDRKQYWNTGNTVERMGKCIPVSAAYQAAPAPPPEPAGAVMEEPPDRLVVKTGAMLPVRAAAAAAVWETLDSGGESESESRHLRMWGGCWNVAQEKEANGGRGGGGDVGLGGELLNSEEDDVDDSDDDVDDEEGVEVSVNSSSSSSSSSSSAEGMSSWFVVDPCR